MNPIWYGLAGALIGAASGIVANWVKPPTWTKDHPGRVVALVVVLAVGGALLAAAGGTLSNSSSDQNSASPTTGPAPAPTAATAVPPTGDPGLTPAGPPTVTTTTRTTTAAPPPRSSVPAELVGSWGGGSEGSTADRSYMFGRDGDVLYRRGSEDIYGTVVVEGSTLTMYFPGVAPQEYRWSVETQKISGYAFTYLYLNGFTYVRQDSP